MSPLSDVTTVASPTLPGASASANAKKPSQGLTFGDLLDTINPLQHIPVVGAIYRAITGDKMSPTAEVVGGALFGGIIGAIGSLADVVFTQATGKDFGASVLSWLGIDKSLAGKTQLADANNSASSSAHQSEPPASTSETATRADYAYRSAMPLQFGMPATKASLHY